MALGLELSGHNLLGMGIQHCAHDNTVDARTALQLFLALCYVISASNMSGYSLAFRDLSL